MDLSRAYSSSTGLRNLDCLWYMLDDFLICGITNDQCELASGCNGARAECFPPLTNEVVAW